MGDVKVEMEVEVERECHICGGPAVCVGQYDNMTKPQPSCDECCGHGNEDGWCEHIEDAEAPNV